MFRKYSDGDPRVDRLRETLAWDLRHEYVLTDTGLHIRHVEKTFLCGGDGGEGIVETTPYGGVGLCSSCKRKVPKEVRWVEPEWSGRLMSLQELCDHVGIELHITNERPEFNETGAAPCGAILGSFDPPVLYVGHINGSLDQAHRIGALHEIAHVVTSPHGFECEPGCGHYAVQYALGLLLVDNRKLLKSTKEVQGLSCPVYGGIMQARAWSLGLLDASRNVNLARIGYKGWKAR